MSIRPYFIVALFVLAFTGCSHAPNTNVNRDATVIELADAMRIFTPPLSSAPSGISWQTGADEDAPKAIEWKTEGLQTTDGGPYSLSRTAGVMVALNGTVQTILEKRVQRRPWRVTLYGPRCCVAQTTIDNQMLNGVWPAFNYFTQHGFKFTITECIGALLDRSALASVDIPGRQRVFVRIHTSCGASAPCSESMDMRYAGWPHSRRDFPGDEYMTDRLLPKDCGNV